MSLDFTVLDQNGTPQRTLSLGVDLHHELITTAAVLGLTRFQDFSDYYQDSEVGLGDLPTLAEQTRRLRNQAGSVELIQFLDRLDDLIAYAIAQRRALNVIAD